jgi:hypothetical protein
VIDWGQDGWTTSSFSGSSGSCVEVRFDHGAVLVRDSKDRRDNRPVIGVPRAGWLALLGTLTDPAGPEPAR